MSPKAVDIMSCVKFKESLSPYLDGQLPASFRSACDEHLVGCPLCRSELAAARSILRGLRDFAVPAAPAGLADSINRRLMIEAVAQRRQPRRSLISCILSWVQPRVMPYSVGAFASLLLFVGIIAALRPHIRALHDAELAIRVSDGRYILANAASEGLYPDITRPVSPRGLAAVRAPFGVESPSLNPRGALAALTMAPSNHREGDDDMVVITDVFTDGRASLADVVQAPRDKKILSEFQDALRENAAFVPASYDQRPQTLRVVFVFQKVDVKERNF